MLWTAESHLRPSHLAATVTADRIVYVLTIARPMIPWFARGTRRRSHSHNLKEIETTFHSLWLSPWRYGSHVLFVMTRLRAVPLSFTLRSFERAEIRASESARAKETSRPNFPSLALRFRSRNRRQKQRGTARSLRHDRNYDFDVV